MTLGEWVSSRRPAVPDAFRPWMEAGEERVSVEGLVGSGLEALSASLDEAASPRARAFSLLAADGWITYAAELAAEAPDPAAALRRVFHEVASSGD